ncbi:glycosyltransferase family 4 protein [Nitrosococcus wardiae]|uniref:Glycosyltransferase family 1 protein n=1 Tax=Nitrosococcus wardiae TaxID=1814290 RepID=A0A4P7BYJ7_9GAMM|nr:glycosyltransferase family 4 protein [Nitrosococcus wardiae]QBQ54407.1 glycosyltransferase family 1 protein [Nitrosococcus wardiae]
MRILFCNYEYPPLGGGGGVVNAHLAEELAKRHDVVVLTSRGPALSKDYVEKGVRIIRVPVLMRRQKAAASMISMLSYLPMGILQGRKLLKQERFDIINTHFVIPTGPVGHALSRFGPIPNVLSVHGGDLYDPSKWTSPHRHALLRISIQRLLRQANRVVGQSLNTVNNVATYYTSEVKPTRIPLGIPRPLLGQANRHEYGFKNEDILLVTVGRLVARKAVDQLIELVRNLHNDRVHLVILGSGPLDDELRNLAAQQAVVDRVHFYGHVDEQEKFRILRMADIFVSTSQHEGFGLVFLEAMACGLPVVCYDYGGQTDFLVSGKTGYLVRLNDRAALIASIRCLIDNPANRQTMGKDNQSLVESYYIDQCASCYEELFKEVIAEKESVIGFAHRS